MAERKNEPPAVDRRTMVAGAGAVGALAAAAALLPGRTPDAAAVAGEAKTAAADTSAGYRLSEHVQHYYRTARI